MVRCLSVAVFVVMIAALPVSAAGISGQYVEARTCDVYTGACFANADTGLAGKHAVLGWKIDKGSLDNVPLDGLSVVAVVAASDTLGLRQTGESKALLIVDEKADPAQREALIKLAKQQGGELLANVLKIETAAVDVAVLQCKDGGCARLKAGSAKIATRCIDAHHDKGCGGEKNYYPPLTKGVKAKPAMATEHTFTGTIFNENWKESDRRGAYIGSFEIN